ncbi:MAG: ParB/RepB/Spo0J family partition protein [Deltaproteobacteria bacterium]|nr:ParB/RepB/Spo0J family partition protein [Deltaproteobacteria bacterium]
MANVCDNIYTPFSFSCPSNPDGLRKSLIKFGQIYPIIISEIEGKESIIDGFRRFQILKELNIEMVFYKLPSLSPSEALNIFLEINTSYRTFNVIEKIRISRFITQNELKTEKELISKAEIGNITENSRLYDFVENFSEDEKKIILEKQLTPVLISRLYKISLRADITSLLNLLHKTRLTHQQVRELITDIYILSMQGQDIRKITDKISNLSFDEIRKEIKSLKNPVLERMECDFRSFKERFKKISLIPPSNFEGDKYSIRTDFSSANELEDIINEIRCLREEWKKNPVL